MKDNIKDLAAIVACILTAYFVANAATVEGALLYGMPAILFCAGVSFVVNWIVAIPSLITSSGTMPSSFSMISANCDEDFYTLTCPHMYPSRLELLICRKSINFREALYGATPSPQRCNLQKQYV